MNRIRNTSQRLVEVLVFYRKKNIKLQPVTPSMPLEALLIPVNPTNSDYDGIIGGTGCNFIFFLYLRSVDKWIYCIGLVKIHYSWTSVSLSMISFRKLSAACFPRDYI